MSSSSPLVVGATAGVAALAWGAYFLLKKKTASLSKDDAMSAEEVALREELTDAHILSHHYGFDELVWNHISARLETDKPDFLVTSGEEHFEEVQPETLVKSSSANANITADVIHSAIYKARPDVGAIVHHHSTAVAAVGVLESGLKYLTQDAAAFYGLVSYHAWEGISEDYDECERLAKSLGPTAHTLIMRNHGALTVGRTVAEAWTRYFFLERVCRVQILCGSNAVVEPPVAVLEHTAEQYVVATKQETEAPAAETTEPNGQPACPEFKHGLAEWGALKRLAKRLRAMRSATHVIPVRCM